MVGIVCIKVLTGFPDDGGRVDFPNPLSCCLGFWFSQQGSIFVFVIIIFVYVRLMNKLDKKYDVEENEEQKQ